MTVRTLRPAVRRRSAFAAVLKGSAVCSSKQSATVAPENIRPDLILASTDDAE